MSNKLMPLSMASLSMASAWSSLTPGEKTGHVPRPTFEMRSPLLPRFLYRNPGVGVEPCRSGSAGFDPRLIERPTHRGTDGTRQRTNHTRPDQYQVQDWIGIGYWISMRFGRGKVQLRVFFFILLVFSIFSKHFLFVHKTATTKIKRTTKYTEY